MVSRKASGCHPKTREAGLRLADPTPKTMKPVAVLVVDVNEPRYRDVDKRIEAAIQDKLGLSFRVINPTQFRLDHLFLRPRWTTPRCSSPRSARRISPQISSA